MSFCLSSLSNAFEEHQIDDNNLMGLLAEDTNYRIRELVHHAAQFMKHGKRNVRGSIASNKIISNHDILFDLDASSE